jgi:hypothetical protein
MNGGKLLDSSKPLMTSLGELGYAVVMQDAQDFELAVPHDLLSNETVDVISLFTFTEHHRCKGMIGSIKEMPRIQKETLFDFVELAKQMRGFLAETECSAVKLMEIISSIAF